MAKPDVEQLLNNAEKVNWLKGVLVMEITDEAMRPYVETEMRMFHNEIKAKFMHGNLCGNCLATNATNCRICSAITSEIVSEHRYRQPCYRNSDITKWLSDPWEIAKCYMSRSKDLEGMPESDLDYTSILNVIINNKRFERLLTGVNMADDSNVFCKGRNARNKTMHSRLHQMTVTDLKDYCDIFIEIVKLTKDDSEQHVKKIEEIRDTPLSITKEEIVNLKEMAARSKETREAIIDEVKTEMRNEANQLMKYIKDEAEKVKGTSSMIANFVEGCKESLYQLTVNHIRQQKPDDIRDEEWTIRKFVEYLKLFPEKNSLSPRHLSILFRKSHTNEDIRKWDIFLMCFILQIELHVPVGNNVLLYVKDVIEVRDELLHNGVAANELSMLCDYLDDPLKSDILGIFTKQYTVSETFQASVALTSWCGEEREFNNKPRYLKKDAKKDLDKNDKIIVLEKEIDTLKNQMAKLNRILGNPEANPEEETIDGGATGGKDSYSYETVADVETMHVSPHERKMVQNMMTSFKINNDILNNGQIDDLNKALGCAKTGFYSGSILLKVEYPSVEKLVTFWKGCTDGTVVKAMSKIRDAYRKQLGNDKLEFDIVLKKKEVTQRMDKIVEDMEAQTKQIKDGVTDLLSRPDVVKPKTKINEEAKRSDIERLDDVEHALKTWTDDIVDRSDQESSVVKTDQTQSFGQDAAKPKIKQQGMQSTSDAVNFPLVMKLHDVPSESGSPMKSDRYGEGEADRLVKFLRQISESLGGGDISTVKTHIRNIVHNAKEHRKTEFDNNISDFTKEAMFKGGISVNLIKQAIRGFDMIKEQPQFGDLVTSKLDAIEIEISEQIRKSTTESQKKSPFEKGDVKTSVSIAEDIEVDESERPRPQLSKLLDKPILKSSETTEVKRSIGRDFEDEIVMKSSSSPKLTSEKTGDFYFTTVPVSTHQSSAKVTEEGPLTPEGSKS